MPPLLFESSLRVFRWVCCYALEVNVMYNSFFSEIYTRKNETLTVNLTKTEVDLIEDDLSPGTCWRLVVSNCVLTLIQSISCYPLIHRDLVFTLSKYIACSFNIVRTADAPLDGSAKAQSVNQLEY